MRRFLLATTAAAVALTLSGAVHAEPDHTLFSPRKFVFDQTRSSQTPAASSEMVVAQADQTAKPAAAELGPVAQQLKELAETRLQQYVPREQDRAGVLAFYQQPQFRPALGRRRQSCSRRPSRPPAFSPRSAPTASTRPTIRRRSSTMPIRPSSPPTS